jgi:predicted phosphoribosyltransferase
LRDRTTAANILGDALKNIIKKVEERKNSIVIGIARGGVIADTIARKLSCRIRHSYARNFVQRKMKRLQ